MVPVEGHTEKLREQYKAVTLLTVQCKLQSWRADGPTGVSGSIKSGHATTKWCFEGKVRKRRTIKSLTVSLESEDVKRKSNATFYISTTRWKRRFGFGHKDAEILNSNLDPLEIWRKAPSRSARSKEKSRKAHSNTRTSVIVAQSNKEDCFEVWRL